MDCIQGFHIWSSSNFGFWDGSLYLDTWTLARFTETSGRGFNMEEVLMETSPFVLQAEGVRGCCRSNLPLLRQGLRFGSLGGVTNYVADLPHRLRSCFGMECWVSMYNMLGVVRYLQILGFCDLGASPCPHANHRTTGPLTFSRLRLHMSVCVYIFVCAHACMHVYVCMYI